MFFVIGLPRSRTAWLANFLTYDDTFCWHELSAMFGDLSEMRDYMERSPGVGTADSSLPARSIEFLRFFPNPKVVVIRRDPKEAARSIAALGVPHVDRLITVSQRGIARIATRASQLLEIDYGALDSQLEALWEFVSSTPYSPTRTSMLCRMNIQMPLDRVIASPVAMRKLIRRLEV